MTVLNSAIWQDEPGWLEKKRQLATMLAGRFPHQDGQEQWLTVWRDQPKTAGMAIGLISHDSDYVARPLSQAVNEYSEMLQENLMEKAIPWQDGQLNAAHLARIDGGQFIYVPDGVKLDESIKLAPNLSGTNPHHVIIVGAHSTVSIEETARLTNPGAVYAGTELLVGTGARVTYRQFKDKMRFIPAPIKMPETTAEGSYRKNGVVRIFAGISKNRSAYKGTDIMLKAARAVQAKYPERLSLQVAEGVPFAQYQEMLNGSDAILDQLYSYTPAMNSLLAMSKGIINIGGGEPENYDILGEKELRPIINVLPTYESCYEEIEKLVLHSERIPLLQEQSIAYVKKHHDYIKVAQQYIDFYKTL